MESEACSVSAWAGGDEAALDRLLKIAWNLT
jgi:hypothetical protein